jgi:hypothetical protein
MMGVETIIAPIMTPIIILEFLDCTMLNLGDLLNIIQHFSAKNTIVHCPKVPKPI